MTDKSNGLAVAALIISIGTAAFSIYQWWNSERSSRINAAMEVSKHYLEDKELNAARMEINMMVSVKQQTVSVESSLATRAYISWLNYVAFLSNNERLDPDYLAELLTCDIISKGQMVRQFAKNPNPNLQSVSVSDIDEFARRLRSDHRCKPTN